MQVNELKSKEIVIQEHLHDTRRDNEKEPYLAFYIGGNHTENIDNEEQFNDLIRKLQQEEDVEHVHPNWKEGRIDVVIKYA